MNAELPASADKSAAFNRAKQKNIACAFNGA